MSILALDIATTTGWAFGAAGEKPRHGANTLEPTGEDLGRYAYAYVQWLTGLVRTLQPKEIVYEAPVLPQPRFNKEKGKIEQLTNIMTLRKLYSLTTLTELVALSEAVPCSEITSGQWRKAFLGQLYPSHNARNPSKRAERDDFKRAAIAVCRMMKWEPNGSDDAEALGIWYVTTCDRNPKFAANDVINRMASAS